jgi:hypothetical protein
MFGEDAEGRRNRHHFGRSILHHSRSRRHGDSELFGNELVEVFDRCVCPPLPSSCLVESIELTDPSEVSIISLPKQLAVVWLGDLFGQTGNGAAQKVRASSSLEN